MAVFASSYGTSPSVEAVAKKPTKFSFVSPGDRCMPQWFKQKHNAQKLQFPSPGGLCIRDRLMWGKSRCNKWSQVIKGIINFLRSSLTPCFFLLMSPVWWLRMLAMLSTETYSSVCSFCFGGTNLTFDVSWFFFASLDNGAFHYKSLLLSPGWNLSAL